MDTLSPEFMSTFGASTASNGVMIGMIILFFCVKKVCARCDHSHIKSNCHWFCCDLEFEDNSSDSEVNI